MLRKKHAAISEESSPESSFQDPFLGNPVDTSALLGGMEITMDSGQLKTTVQVISEAMRPVRARQAITDILVDWRTFPLGNPLDQLANIEGFLAQLVSSEVVTRSEELIEEHAPRLEFSLHLLRTNDNDRELAIKQGLEDIERFVVDSYAAASTPEIRNRFVGEYEAWIGNQAS